MGGKYELVSLLGRGSMGEVWVAHHRTLGERLAIKFIAWADHAGAEIEGRSTAIARFRFEARVAARLSRKTRHVVRVSDYGEDEGLPYLVMELLEGRSLFDGLLMRGPMSPALAREVVTQIARGLEAAHADGIVHRDLKPANVFLAKDEDGRVLVKLLDFGIARAVQPVQTTPLFKTAFGLVFGTPGYMSPEQAFGGAVDARCDLWALATLAYEALTTELPFPGVDADQRMRHLGAGQYVPVHTHDATLPAGLDAFFRRAFAPAAADRFASGRDLARAFDDAVASAIGPQASHASVSGGHTLKSANWVPSARILGRARRLFIRPAWGVAMAVLVAAGGWVAGARSGFHSAPASPPVSAAFDADEHAVAAGSVVTRIPATPEKAPETARVTPPDEPIVLPPRSPSPRGASAHSQGSTAVDGEAARPTPPLPSASAEHDRSTVF